jgi:hypothetical protein
MPTLKLVLGFTDEINDSVMRIDENREEIEHQSSYNLYKQDPGLEKVSFTWTICTDNSAVLRALDATEDIIRKPHLKLIITDTPPNSYVPDYTSYRAGIQFLNLIPMKTNFATATEEDFSTATMSHEFGTMYINIHEMYQDAGYLFSETLYGSYVEREIDKISTNYEAVCTPKFELNLDLRPQFTTFENNEKIERAQYEEWIRDNKEELVAAGADFDRPQLIGMIPFAKLDSDPWETYETISKNPYICRWSIIKED